MARRSARVVLLLAALAASCSNEAPSGPSEPVASSNAAPGDAPSPSPPPPPPPPPPPTFAEQVAGLVGDAQPSAESSKRAWAHYKAKAYGDAQKEFALAALHEPAAWKPAFNLACASALAADEAMVRIALTEARARSPDVVPGKARSDGDLAAFRSMPWFEEVLAGAAEPGDDDPHAGLSNGTMYFALDTGTAQAIAALDDLGEFALHLADARSIEVAPDGREYVLRSSFEIAPNEVGAKPITRVDMGSVYQFDVLAGNELWAANQTRLGHYSSATETWTVRALDPVAGMLRGLEVDAAGTVWLATTDTLSAYSGEYEAIAELPAPITPNIELLRGADGKLYLHRSGDVLRLENGEWGSAGNLAPPPGGRIERVLVLADGSLVGFTLPDHQLLRVGKGGTTTRLRLDDETQVLALAVDAGKRVWASTPLGLFVIDPEFRRIIRRYGVGSIDAFTVKGKVGDVVEIVAVGGALALPDSEAPRNVISGRLVHAGKPLVNTAFEMCAEPARTTRELEAKGSLCGVSEEDREVREHMERELRNTVELDDVILGMTDAEGRFRVTHVVDLAYDFAVLVDGKVRASKDWVCCEHMPDEGVYRMGDVTLH